MFHLPDIPLPKGRGGYQITGASISGVGSIGAGAVMRAASMAGAGAAVAMPQVMSGANQVAGGGQALMTAFKKARENVDSGSDILSSLGKGKSFSSGLESQGKGPISSVMGMGGAQKAGRIFADAAANLGQGISSVAQKKATQMKEKALDRLSETAGGKVAREISPIDERDPLFSKYDSKD